MSLPDTLTWLLTKDTSCFIKARNGRTKRSGAIQLTSEAGNLMNLNKAKFSGSNNKSIGLSLDGNVVKMGVKSTKKANKPAKATGAVVLKKNFRSSVATIKKQVLDNHYRADLSQAALARYSALYKLNRVAQGTVKAPEFKRGRK
ncbi:unnamed protein product [Heterosigma akashiwo]|mmetsp:Transcript_18284/g.27605  ORF Transcript_18284/g.27605 Transcript_18284/m.27605 type:complete len:145 (+) Transcript_18284:80-514(+)